MQFTQLLFINRARSAGEQALGALRLREGDHIANGGCTRHHRDDTVQTEGDAAVGRRTVLQGVKQEAELKLGFFRTNLQCAEDLALNIGTVDTDGTAADFPSRSKPCRRPWRSSFRDQFRADPRIRPWAR